MPPLTLRVLIWGKTYPELSSSYIETVCTGGCLEDGRPVRLYPIPFRYLHEVQQFRLYDWVDVGVRAAKRDPRPESYHVDGSRIEVVDHLGTDEGTWRARREVIFRDPSWHYECLEDLKARQREDGSSLGFIPVGAIERVWIEERSAEDREKHEAKIARLKGIYDQPTLFPGDEKTTKALEFMPYRFRVAWRCERLEGERACPGHTASVLDWGLGELCRREGAEAALARLESVCDLEEHELAFFCGNMKRYPQIFSIVGLWYPKRKSLTQRKAERAGQPDLFDPP